MPKYVIVIDAPDTVLDRKGLDRLEDIVYDELVDEHAASDNIDVYAKFD